MFSRTLNLDGLRTTLEKGRRRAAGPDADRVTLLLICALLVACLGIAFGLSGNGYHAGFHGLQTLSHAALPDIAWASLSNFGDGKYLFVVSLLIARRRPEVFWALIVSGVLAAICAPLLKDYFNALRPPAVLPTDELMLIGPLLKYHSFPSGHTLTAFMFFGVLTGFSRTWTTRWLFIGAATLVGLSRVAMGVHWPHDVIAGAFTGLTIAAFGVWIARHWQAGLQPGWHLTLLALPVTSIVLLATGNHADPSTWVAYPLCLVGIAMLVIGYRDLFQAR